MFNFCYLIDLPAPVVCERVRASDADITLFEPSDYSMEVSPHSKAVTLHFPRVGEVSVVSSSRKWIRLDRRTEVDLVGLEADAKYLFSATGASEIIRINEMVISIWKEDHGGAGVETHAGMAALMHWLETDEDWSENYDESWDRLRPGTD